MSDKQKVTAFEPKCPDNIHLFRKEKHFYRQVSIINLDTAEEVLIYREYRTNAVSYSCLWVDTPAGADPCRGGGKAGGWGYHRPSAAAQEAFTAAGFTFAELIAGIGDAAVEKACRHAADHIYPGARLMMVKAHG